MMFQFPLQRKWVPDSESYKCFTCKSEFGIFVGRHHCRVCGRIFCKKCTLWASLPVSWILKNVRTETTTATAWLPWLPWHWEEKRKHQQVCLQCKKFHDDVFRKECKIQMKQCEVLLLCFPFTFWSTCMFVSKTWYRCFSEGFRLLREVSYCSPVSKDVWSFFWNHRQALIPQTKFFLFFLNHYNRQDPFQKQLIPCLGKKFAKKKPKPRARKKRERKILLKLFTSLVPSQLTCYHFIEYLSLTKDQLIPSVISKWLPCISFSCAQLRTFLPLLVEYDDPVMKDFLWKKLQDFPSLLLDMHWWQEMAGTAGTAFEDKLTLEQKEIIHHHSTFVNQTFVSIEKHAQLHHVPLTKTLYDHVDFFQDNKTCCGEICPSCGCENSSKSRKGFKLFMPSQKELSELACWEPESTFVISSKTKPLLLTLKENETDLGESRKGYIFKSDDVCRDAILIGAVQLMDEILHRELKINLNAIKYTVVPVGKNRGLIEVVPGAKTLFEIKYILKQNLLVWLSNHNQEEKVVDLRKRFIQSCAFYCLVGFLFGIGDRHSRNILITEQGQLFHIDFGYIMGEHPNKIFSNPELQLTKEMLECMGGETSSSYQDFRTLCGRMYQCLQTHVRLFLSLFRYLTRHHLLPMSCEELTTNLEQRFLTNFEFTTFETKILVSDSSRLMNRVSEKVVDLYHFYLPHTHSYSHSDYSHSSSFNLKESSPPKFSSSPSKISPTFSICVICKKIFTRMPVQLAPHAQTEGDSFVVIEGEEQMEIEVQDLLSQQEDDIGDNIKRSKPLLIPIPNKKR